ncbi:hypothetical protein PFUGPA_02832 [Plasmodium falciparum Palo Alto/Uganda]|uniref:Uncharacterized protein n=1 Tax=Plasmodium falciparum (isolate Palo Alto / Uganda) TaxID=57270 RepID=W4IYX4_PLAFP|nr:hypothetical protein PFUGPA_02832 [Plasmodium falciparum Palo Alto/Uganda]
MIYIELEKEKKLVIEFFKSQKLTTEIAKHFINVGFDSMESLLYLNVHILDDIEKFNKVNWLPGHKIRLQQMFSNIDENVKKFYMEYEEGAKNNMDYNCIRLVKKMSPKNYSRRAVSKLLNCLSEEIEKQQPKNVIHFMVDFLCKNYGSHLRGFAHVWDVDEQSK